MKQLLHIFMALVVVISTSKAIAQENQAAAFWPTRTAEELAVAPSPEVATMPAYRQAEINYTTGRATLSYPLLEWQVGAYPMAVGLTYRVGAFTTEELAGWIGMGWNLTGTGSVSRVIKGLPDEKVTFDLRDSQSVDTTYICDLMDYRKEASLDRYSYNCPGGSGSFVIRQGEIIELPESDNEIEQIGQISEGVRDFRVTTPDGTKYEFTEREHIEYRYLPYCPPANFKSPNYNAVSTWQLSRIITAEGADTIKIEYTQIPRWNRNNTRPTETLSMRTSDIVPNIDWLSSGLPNSSEATNTTIFDDQRIPFRIVSRTATVEFGYDTSENFKKYISSITLKDYSGNIVKSITLSGQGSDRRKLNKITTTAADGTLNDSQEFIYHADSGHPVGDIFNYANAPESASPSSYTAIYSETAKLNPRRRPNPTYAISGALQQSISSTGVITKYEYEPNSIILRPRNRAVNFGRGRDLTIDTLIGDIINPDDPIFPIDPVDPPADEVEDDSTLTIGVRLKSITMTDENTGRRQVRELSYSDGMCNMDLTTLSRSDFISMSGSKWFRLISFITIESIYDTSSSLLYGSKLPGIPIEQAGIYYGKVTESVSGTGIDHPLITDYEFDTSRCNLERLYQGREMSSDPTDTRTLRVSTIPVGGPSAYRLLFDSHIARGYFREHIGAEPELSRRTSYRWLNGEYTPLETEQRFYSTIDSVCIATDIHHEPLVRQIKNFVSEAIDKDLRSLDDISYFNIHTEASSRRLDSIATIKYFADGSQRLRTTKRHYANEHSLPLVPFGLRPPIDFPPLTLSHPVWKCDSIVPVNSMRIAVGETIREGGHTLEHHQAYSSMVNSNFYSSATQRGLKQMPVRQMWVMNGSDTLHRQYEYGLFSGLYGQSVTRPTNLRTDIARIAVDNQRINGYTLHGKPISVSQTGKPLTQYEWGYDGELLTALILRDSPSDDSEVLRSQYLWQPMIGCTQIANPSGKISRYTYTGNRLSKISDTQNRTLTEYTYELHAETNGTYAGQNRISTTDYILDANAGTSATALYDGFGKSVAEIGHEMGGGGEDVAKVSYYDAIGRPITQWMPLNIDAETTDTAIKRDTPLRSAAQAQYGDVQAFSAITYPYYGTEQPNTTTLGGIDFAEHPASSEISCSNPNEQQRRVVRWNWNGATLTADGYYDAGELDALKTEDGDGRVTWVFTDCLGRQILQRQLTESEGVFADTYTVSDSWGNPLLVLPPEATARISTTSSAANADILDSYAYIYRYDAKLRLRYKKLPGCQAIQYVYDSENRVAFTRDGNQAQRGRRSFMLYDRLGRPVVTGTCQDALSEDFWSETATDAPQMVATRTTSAVAIGESSSLQSLSAIGYETSSDVENLLAQAQLLTATYYDDYSFIPQASSQKLASLAPAGYIGFPLGLPTGELTAVLGIDTETADTDTRKPMLKVSYYDSEERIISAATIQSDDKTYAVNTAYTRGGLPKQSVISLATESNHPSSSLSAITTDTEYDIHGRVTKSLLSGVGTSTLTISENSYDSYGNLQRTDYLGGMSRTQMYDMHGWLREWNTPFVSQQLRYADGANPSYSGRVSAKITGSYGSSDRYDYSYDRLGRLISADFSREMPPNVASKDGNADYSTTYSYDLQGNILSLTRQGMTVPGFYFCIDDIQATFNGNQLSSLSDDALTVLLESSLDLPRGSWSGDDFSYDANGNQTRDMSRSVTHISYNELNLPSRVEFASGGRIDYLYSATGTKLQEAVYDADGGEIVKREYVGAFEFENDTLVRISLAEGYITACDSTYHAYIPDYQGNIVGVYNTRTNTLEQRTDYYPYGLPHASISSEVARAEVNRRKFGGKELMSDHGYNSYDFTARHQNPAFPHFTTPDPLAEKFKHLSPHLFCAGDPINYIDQNGDSIAVLIEPKGAMSFGHMAILIQNDSGKWELYSKNGTDENFGIYGTSNKDDDEGDTTDPPKTFLHSDKNVDKNKNIKYTEAYVIHTTKEEDNIIREVVKSKIETKKYNLFRDNCAQLVQDGLRSINKPDGSLSPKEKSNKILFRATNLYNIFIEEFSPNKIFQRIKEQIPGVQITINSN